MYQGLISGDRSKLSRSITLVESIDPQKRLAAQLILNKIRQNQKLDNRTLRIGLSGPPGAGKSTFIEAFGTMLTKQNHRLAVLAVDPSAVGYKEFSGGSLLGDKTRMWNLSRNEKAFIRPSPSCGTLGGVARNTAESVVMCEAAGYDIILIETMGVGQAEYAVTNMVDLFCLIVTPAGGDELQGLKRGIVEEANMIAVNKYDGDLKPAARRIAMGYTSALRLTRQKIPFWRPRVELVSSVMPYYGLDDLWKTMQSFESKSRESGYLEDRRRKQFEQQMWALLQERIMESFVTNKRVNSVLSDVQSAVHNLQIEPGLAADYLLHVLNDE